jgi:hypothetical protein
MRIDATNVEDYLKAVPLDRLDAIQSLRTVILDHLPEGFVEDFQYGMISYVIPLSLYPRGYHAKKETPLPLLSLAVQKRTINLYHMGIYAKPELLAWFTEAHKKKLDKKPDMGKSCIRFPHITPEVLSLVGELCTKMTPEELIQLQEDRVG